MKRIALLLCSVSLLTACQTVPTVQVTEVCPRLPELQLDAPERNWLDQMQSFLSGTLPTQPDYSLTSKPVKLPMTQPEMPK